MPVPMPSIQIAALLSATLGADPAAIPDAAMLRYPDIGRDDIVFVFAGNLWLVPKSGGTARPLTSATKRTRGPAGPSSVFRCSTTSVTWLQ